MAKIDDVARLAGVSKGTVSNVFSQKRPTSKEVTERVLRASRELNYVPNHIARSLVTKQTMAIGLTIPHGQFFFSVFHNQFINAVILEASRYGYRVLLDTMPPQEVKTQSLTSYPIDGAIVMSPTEKDERIQSLHDHQIPFVTIGRDRRTNLKEDATVDNDNAKIMQEIGRYLTGLGHRRILFLNAGEQMTVSKDRREAFLKFMDDCGIGADQAIICHKPDLQTSEYLNYGYEETLQALRPGSGAEPVTAIIADDDRTAFSVMNAIKDLNLKVPEDVSLFVICGDMSILDKSSPSLTSMDLQPSELGVQAVRMLMQKLGVLSGEDQRRIIVESKIVERNSCDIAKNANAETEDAMSKRVWQVGMIGLGDIGEYHMKTMSGMPNVKVAAICDVNEEALKRVGDRLALAENKRYKDYVDLIADKDIDFVIAGVSNDRHYGVVKAAIEHGKPIVAEKPFTRTMEEAEKLLALYKKNPIPCMIGFSYRYKPCFQYVKQLLARGELGKIRHIHAQYLQEENAPMFNHPYTWRFSKKVAGSGVLADIGSHMLDAARFFIGEILRVNAMLSTFIKERVDPRTGKRIPIDVDDFAGFQCELEGGVMGTFHTHKNAIGADNQFSIVIYGDLGTVSFSVERPNEVELTMRSGGSQKLTRQVIEVDDTSMKTMLQDFIDGLSGKSSAIYPSLWDGYRNQQALQMVMDAAEDGVTRRLPDRENKSGSGDGGL